MSAALALQRALYAALTSDQTLAGLLAVDPYGGSPSVPAVYDNVPQAAAPESATPFPYIVIGDHTSVPFDTDDVNGQETVVVFHVWDRRESRDRAKQIVDAIYNVLHDAELTVSGQDFVYCFWEFGESVPDEDPLTQHEVTRFRVVTQQP